MAEEDYEYIVVGLEKRGSKDPLGWVVEVYSNRRQAEIKRDQRTELERKPNVFYDIQNHERGFR